MAANKGISVLQPGMVIKTPDLNTITLEKGAPKISEKNWALSTGKGGNKYGANITGDPGDPSYNPNYEKSPFDMALTAYLAAGGNPDDYSGITGGGQTYLPRGNNDMSGGADDPRALTVEAGAYDNVSTLPTAVPDGNKQPDENVVNSIMDMSAEDFRLMEKIRDYEQSPLTQQEQDQIGTYAGQAAMGAVENVVGNVAKPEQATTGMTVLPGGPEEKGYQYSASSGNPWKILGGDLLFQTIGGAIKSVFQSTAESLQANYGVNITAEDLAEAQALGVDFHAFIGPTNDTYKAVAVGDIEGAYKWDMSRPSDSMFDVARAELNVWGEDAMLSNSHHHLLGILAKADAQGFNIYDENGDIIQGNLDAYVNTLSREDMEIYLRLSEAAAGQSEDGTIPGLMDFWPSEYSMSGWYGDEAYDPYMGWGNGYGGGGNYASYVTSPSLTRWDYS